VHEVTQRFRTLTLAGCLAGLSFLAPSAAHAGTKECIAAADEGQKLRDDSKLTAAREKFIACAAKACPGAIAKQCSQWLVDAEKDTPSVTFRALDDQGKETLEVRVLVDDVQLLTAIEARALPVDPGEHKVRFERADGTSVEDKVMLRPGEKNRIVELSFQKTPAPVAGKPVAPVTLPPAEQAPGFHVPLLGWIGLGAAVAGGVMTAAFAVSANSAETHLRDTCAPSCDPAEKSSVDTKVILANVGLGVGIAGLGLAVVSTIIANTGSKPKKEPTSGVALDVGPGALLLRGRF
jgi:hypothetical protein